MDCKIKIGSFTDRTSPKSQISGQTMADLTNQEPKQAIYHIIIKNSDFHQKSPNRFENQKQTLSSKKYIRVKENKAWIEKIAS